MNNVTSGRPGHCARRVLWGGALVLALAPFQVSAGVIGKGGPNVLSNTAGNVWEVVYDGGNTVSTTRTWAKGTEVGSAKATDVFDWMLKNRKVPLSVSTRVSASVAARVAAKTLPIVGTASVAYDIWNALGCKIEGGSVVCDNGSEPSPILAYKFSPNEGESVGPFASSPQAAAKIAIKEANTAECIADCHYPATGATFLVKWTGGQMGIQIYRYRDTDAKGCPSGEVRSDGKCSTGSFGPASEDDLTGKFGEHGPKIPGFADKVPGIVKEGVDNGVPVPSDTPTVNGPSSVPGPVSSSTTTDPNGVSKVTTTQTNYNFNYYDEKIVVTEQTVTTNPDGSTTTETKEETENPCTLDPTIAGCVKLGDPGTAELPTVDKPITFTPVIFADSSSCPAPVAFSALGHSYSFSYEPMCETIGVWVRALVLAIGAFVASWVFVQGLKA